VAKRGRAKKKLVGCATCASAHESLAKASTISRVDVPASGTDPRIQVAFQGDDRMSPTPHETYQPRRGRICRECGFVVVFVPPPALEELRAKLPK